MTAAVASIQWAPRQLSPLRVTRRVSITPPSGPSSRRGLSPRPHDRCWRLGVIQKNSSHRGRRPNDTPRQLLPPQGEDAAVDAAGDRRRRGYHPSVGAAAVVVSVTSTPRQLLSPRGGRDEAPWNSSHPSPSLAVTAAVASTLWAPQQLPPLGEGVAARNASRRRASAAAAV